MTIPSNAATPPPKQHTVSYLTAQGKPQELGQRATPALDADEVLVKIGATAINPVDYKMRDWGIFVQQYPAVLGSDAAGTVAAVGKSVSTLRPGHRVFFQGIIGKDDYSTFQQYAKIPADLVARTPDNVSDDEAAGVALASIAAVVGFYHPSGFDITPHPWEAGGAEVGRGKSIVILGGSSSVGQYAIQLARLSGFSTIVTGSSSAHHDHLRSLGATVVLDRAAATPSDYARAATADGHTFAMLYDAIAVKETHLEGVAILQHANKAKDSQRAAKSVGLPTSTLVTVYTPEPVVEQAAKAGDGEEVHLKTVWGISSRDDLRPTATAFYNALGGPDGWLATKQYHANRPQLVQGGLSALDKAMDRNRDGVSGVKLVVRPFEK